MTDYTSLITTLNERADNTDGLEAAFSRLTITRVAGLKGAKEIALNVTVLIKKIQEWQKEQRKSVAAKNGIDVSKSDWEKELKKIQVEIERVNVKIRADTATNVDIENMPVLHPGDTLDLFETFRKFIFEEEYELLIDIVATALGVDAEEVEGIPMSCVWEFIIKDKVIHPFLPPWLKLALIEQSDTSQSVPLSHGALTHSTLNREQRRKSLTGKN